MADALVKHAFVSAIPQGTDPTKIRTNDWNAPLLFTGGAELEVLTRSAASATGAAWTAVPAPDLSGYVLTSDARLSDARVPLAHTQAFSSITGLPSTLAGYGIPAITKADVGLGSVENTALSTGNAATATALQTARTINGVSFNGTANVTVAAAAATLTGTALPAAVVTSSLTSVGTLSSLLTTGVITIDKGLAANSARSIVFPLNETGAADFSIGIYSAANPFGVRRDQVLKWGYNLNTATNTKVLAGEHSLVYDIENYFTPDASGTATEAHLVYTNAANTKSIRLFSQFINRATDDISTDFTSDRFSLTTAAGGVEQVTVTAGSMVLKSSIALIADVNNAAVLKQYNVAHSQAVSLIKLDNQNGVQLGDGNAACVRTDRIVIFGDQIFSGYPALKANGALLAVRNGTDAADASIQALTFKTMTALVALGGGAAPTLGTIGGSGPVTAAQNTWLKMLDSTGATFWVPVWK